MKRLVLPAVHVACWLAIGAAFGCLALQLAGDHVGRYVTPAQALTPWLVPVTFVAAVIAITIGRHAAAATGAVTGIVFLALVAPLVFPHGLPPAAPGDELTIAHANLLYSNDSIDAAIDALHATDADVIAVSELTPEFATAFEASPIGERYPFTVTRPADAAAGLGIWSRVPISAGVVPTGSRMTLTAEVDVDGRPMSVVLAHPLPPLFHAERWRREMEALAAMPAGEQGRSVVVADLNVSYFHPPYRRFLDRTGLHDVHAAFGRGFSVSWPTDEAVPPFVRLDHALVGSDVTATAITDFDVPGGDHRGFTIAISWAATA